MEVGEVPKGIRWSAKAGGPPKVRIGEARTRGWGRHNITFINVDLFSNVI